MRRRLMSGPQMSLSEARELTRRQSIASLGYSLASIACIERRLLEILRGDTPMTPEKMGSYLAIAADMVRDPAVRCARC